MAQVGAQPQRVKRLDSVGATVLAFPLALQWGSIYGIVGPWGEVCSEERHTSEGETRSSMLALTYV